MLLLRVAKSRLSPSQDVGDLWHCANWDEQSSFQAIAGSFGKSIRCGNTCLQLTIIRLHAGLAHLLIQRNSKGMTSSLCWCCQNQRRCKRYVTIDLDDLMIMLYG